MTSFTLHRLCSILILLSALGIPLTFIVARLYYSIACPNPGNDCKTYYCNYIETTPGVQGQYYIVANGTFNGNCTVNFIGNPVNMSTSGCSNYQTASLACLFYLPSNGSLCYTSETDNGDRGLCAYMPYCYRTQAYNKCVNAIFTWCLISFAVCIVSAFLLSGIMIGIPDKKEGESVPLLTVATNEQVFV